MREEFDFDAALVALQDGRGLTGKDGILTPLKWARICKAPGVDGPE